MGQPGEASSKLVGLPPCAGSNLSAFSLLGKEKRQVAKREKRKICSFRKREKADGESPALGVFIFKEKLIKLFFRIYSMEIKEFIVMCLIVFLGIAIIISVQQSKIPRVSDTNRTIINAAEKIRVSHILVKSYEEAEDILNKLKNGGNFSELAMNYSLDSSKFKGGDLGEFGRGTMVKEFEDAAFALKVGELSEPVQTQYGWHIILRTE